MASTSRSEAVEMSSADAMIEEFIRLQKAQVTLQEAQVTLLKRMFGSSPAAATTPTKDAEGDPGKETSAVTGDFMHGGQDGMAVSSVASMEEADEISEEESEASSVKDPLEGMHLREVPGNVMTPWEHALICNDWTSLMTQLRDDPSLMMQTLNGRTVLHEACINGCKPLAHQVLENCTWNLGNRHVYDYDQPTGVDAVFVAVDEKTKLTAADINTYFVGQEYTTRSLNLSEIRLPSRQLADCKKRLQEHQCSTRSTPCTPDRQQLVKLIRDDINRLLLDETNRQFLDDFNNNRRYNFAREHTEFTFHSACDNLTHRRQYYIDYLDRVMGCLKTDGGEKLKCLLELQDWRGNPPFHTFIISGEMKPYIGRDDLRGTCGVDFMISTLKHVLQSSPNFLPKFINASDA